MNACDLQGLCELGQRQLMDMQYLGAEATLAAAAQHAIELNDFDSVARIYLPLQEARRQRRQRAGEGVVCLDLLARGPDDRLDARKIVEQIPHGQLLVAGWASIEAALAVRRLQEEQGLYLDTFLAAVYPSPGGNVIAIVPLPDTPLPPPGAGRLPDHGILLEANQLPTGRRPGTDQTYCQVMDLWERLHAPFLRVGDEKSEPLDKIAAYQKTILVDYACELAHQRLCDAAKALSRS